LLNLPDLWRAAGRPADWRRQVGKGFIDHIARKAGVLPQHTFDVEKGKGTWAHWQIAMAYAKHLSPALIRALLAVARELFSGVQLKTHQTCAPAALFGGLNGRNALIPACSQWPSRLVRPRGERLSDRAGQMTTCCVPPRAPARDAAPFNGCLSAQ
jgi:hypothetical protein